MLKYLAFVLFFVHGVQNAPSVVQNSDQICGKWMVSEGNLEVQVYKAGEDFKAKIIWFKGDPGDPMQDWRDIHNPDPKLRTRKILGMEVLNGLRYDADGNSWEDGTVYDAKHGHTWNAAAYIDKKGLLHVRGYWHLKLFGRTLLFKRA
jgi:uncharacterized protein (DUF2147 family)